MSTPQEKQQLYDDGVVLSKTFLLKNGFSTPEFHTYQQVFQTFPKEHRTYRILQRLESGPAQGYATGYYSNKHVFVNLDKAAHVAINPGHMRWSFPGYKTDRTPIGVVAHETGHFVDDNPWGDSGSRFALSVTPQWQRVASKSKKITSYEPIPAESFAETMRLFILNPDLLAQGSPERYNFLTKVGGLQPSETRDFKQVLCNHPAYIAAAEKWILKK